MLLEITVSPVGHCCAALHTLSRFFSQGRQKTKTKSIERKKEERRRR